MDDRLIAFAFVASLLVISFFIDSILGYCLITGPMAVTFGIFILIIISLANNKEDRVLRCLVGVTSLSLLVVWCLSTVNMVQQSLGELCFLLAILLLLTSDIIYRRMIGKEHSIFALRK